jgi:ABC-type multidrug transport system ATPase subunit
MEEADVLCNRIAIVNNGVMSCLGSQTRLKDLYGGGYHLFINSKDPKLEKKLVEFIHKLLPLSVKLRHFNGQFVYKVPVQGFKAEKLFNEIENSRKELCIEDWGISQCSLEDVFTRICDI